MRNVKVKKTYLLATVEKNRETHIREYKEACLGYREQALEKISEAVDCLKRQVSVLKDGEAIELAAIHFSLPPPKSHSDDYDQVISMLRMSVEDVIELDRESFSQYVMDNWEWRNQWEGTKASYAMRR